MPTLDSPLSTSTNATHSTVEFEFLLNECTDDEWVLNRDLDIAVTLERCAGRSSWDLPTAAPEVVLFYKAGGDLTPARVATRNDQLRAPDEQDFVALLPTLTEEQRSWLRESIGKLQPRHPWLPRLAS